MTSFKSTATILMAAVLLSQGAWARTLEDVLKEKGVITEEDYREIVKSKPSFDYTLGKGFTFTSPHEKFQLTLGGRMQFRYTFTEFDDYYALSATKLYTKKSDTSQFDAKKVRLILQGYAYSKDLTYKLEADVRQLASSDTRKGLVETYMNYRFIDEAQIKVGQMKTPFSRQELTSDGALQFVDRSVVVDSFKPTYDIGAMLNGKIAGGLAYYYAGVFGGAGQTSTRNTNDNLFVARAVVNPLGDVTYSEADLEGSKKPLLSIGANFFMNTLNKTTAATGPALDSIANYAASSGWLGKNALLTTGSKFAVTDKIDINSYGADLTFKWMGLSLQGEYLLGQAESQFTPLKNLLRAHGFYVQTGYMIIPQKLEVAFRYSYLDPDRDVANDHVVETIGAASYYFNKHNLKLQADVGNTHTQGNQTDIFTGKKKPTDDLQYRAQVQLIF